MQPLARFAMFLGTIAFISWLYPTSTQFKYQFEVGKPWIYEDLISPTDFPIYKTEAQIAEEEQEIVDQMHPFYKRDTTIEIRAIRVANSNLKRLLVDTTLELKLSDRDEILENLAAVYSNGIVQLDAIHTEFDLDDVLFVLHNQTSYRRKVSEFYTLKSAFDEIIPPDIANRRKLIKVFENILIPNIQYDQSTTELQEKDNLSTIQVTEGGVQLGQKIIEKGAIVDKRTNRILESMKRSYGEQLGKNYDSRLVYLGYLIITMVIMTLLWIYLKQFQPGVIANTRKLVFVLLLISLFAYLTYYALSVNLPSIYLVPYCVIPIILRTFFGNRLAFFVSVIVLLLVAFITPYGKEFFFLHIGACLVSILANVNAYYWSRFFLATFYIFIAYAISYIGISLVQEGDFQSINYNELGWFGVNVILTLLAYPLIPIFEKLFGFVSDITLVELGDVNKPLLKELQLEAPGTFQHSVQVGNLAEAAANEIKVNPLLVKVASLYHDIGKIKNPLYYIENQNTNFNPHENVSYEESAEIIIDHVIAGIEMAKKNRLPDLLIDFIRTHHGTTRVEYFYRKYKEEHPDDEVDDSKFRYPGPLPYSKETAIVMMADSVEASCKSLQNPSGDDISDLVDKVIKQKMDDGQFSNSDLTFKEIDQIKRVFKKMLKSIYHIRIAYPETKKVVAAE